MAIAAVVVAAGGKLGSRSAKERSRGVLVRPRLEEERWVSRDLEVERPSDTVGIVAPRPLVWAKLGDTGLVVRPSTNVCIGAVAPGAVEPPNERAALTVGDGTISSSEELVAAVPEDPCREELVSTPGAPNSAVASLSESAAMLWLRAVPSAVRLITCERYHRRRE